MRFAAEVVRNQQSRRSDQHGSGQFHAARGSRLHYGIDIAAQPGEEVFSPIDGEVLREALPYKSDPSLRGLFVLGTDAWNGFELKLFYCQGILTGKVRAGTHIGFAQDLRFKYQGIVNHVHLEVRYGGRILGPSEIYGLCF